MPDTAGNMHRSWSVPAPHSEACSKKRGDDCDNQATSAHSNKFRRLSNGQFARKDGGHESICGVRRQDGDALENRIQELEDENMALKKRVEMRNMQIIELTGDLYHMKAQHSQELKQLRHSDPMEDLATMLRMGKTPKGVKPAAAAAAQQTSSHQAVASSKAKSSHPSQDMPAAQLLTSNTSSNPEKPDSKDIFGEILGNLDFGSDTILTTF